MLSLHLFAISQIELHSRWLCYRFTYLPYHRLSYTHADYVIASLICHITDSVTLTLTMLSLHLFAISQIELHSRWLCYRFTYLPYHRFSYTHADYVIASLICHITDSVTLTLTMLSLHLFAISQIELHSRWLCYRFTYLPYHRLSYTHADYVIASLICHRFSYTHADYVELLTTHLSQIELHYDYVIASLICHITDWVTLTLTMLSLHLFAISQIQLHSRWLCYRFTYLPYHRLSYTHADYVIASLICHITDWVTLTLTMLSLHLFAISQIELHSRWLCYRFTYLPYHRFSYTHADYVIASLICHRIHMLSLHLFAISDSVTLTLTMLSLHLFAISQIELHSRWLCYRFTYLPYHRLSYTHADYVIASLICHITDWVTLTLTMLSLHLFAISQIELHSRWLCYRFTYLPYHRLSYTHADYVIASLICHITDSVTLTLTMLSLHLFAISQIQLHSRWLCYRFTYLPYHRFSYTHAGYVIA